MCIRDSSTSKVSTDTIPLTDSPAILLGKPLTDSTSVSESISLGANVVRSDTLSVSEDFDKVVSYNRLFTDSPVIQESIDVALVIGASSILNAGALNSAPINS